VVAFSTAVAASKKPKETPRVTVISSVSGDSITITESGVAKTYTTNQFTEITLKGKKAKLSDLQAGMAVSVTLGTDATKVSRIAADDPPAAQPPATPRRARLTRTV
jgi:hypothetical protein